MEQYNVNVGTRCAIDTLEPADRGVPGDYTVFICPGHPDYVAAGIALDVFHVTVPIKCLDDFCIEVQDQNGRRIEENADHVTYSGCELGYLAVAFERGGGGETC